MPSRRHLGSASLAGVERRPWLTRNLIVLCGVSFLQDAASELLYPILPIFLTTVLGAPVVAVGAVEGLAEAVASVAKIGAGRIADRAARRPLVAVGYGLAAAGKAIIAGATVWPVVLVGRATDRLGKGIRGAPRDALLVDGIERDARGRAFGLHRAADTAGAVVGPLIGLAGYEALHHHLRPLLLIAVIPALASTALVAAVKEDTATALRAGRGVRPGELRAGGWKPGRSSPDRLPRVLPQEPLPPAFRRAVTVLVLFNAFNFPDALLLLRVRALGFSIVGVILVYVTYNAAYPVLSYPAGAAADRLRPPRVYAIGVACFAACYLGLGIVTTTAWVWPLLVVYGGFTAATDGVGKAWVSRLVTGDQQGRAQGLFQGLTGGAILVAGLWAGALWHHDGRLPLVISGAVGVVASAVLALGSQPG
jgi:MFS family permease